MLFPTVSAQMRANERRAAETLQPVLDDVELVLDGEARTYLTVTFALPGDDGRAVETCTIATDVTEVREKESRRREQHKWEEWIHAALDQDRLLVYAQPVFALRDGASEWRELLARLDPPGSGVDLLKPVDFLPAAERWELIQAIDIRMVELALGLEDGIGTSVNLSAVTLCDPDARHEILARLRAMPAAAERLVFEITETAAAGQLAAAECFAAELAGLGCGIGLDDFGTGFGAFTYLRRLPLRFVKIDASFVRTIATSHSDRRVVSSIIGVAREFGLRTVAEGVEDEATLAILRELGVDYAQGYLLGAPEPVDSRLLHTA